MLSSSLSCLGLIVWEVCCVCRTRGVIGYLSAWSIYTGKAPSVGLKRFAGMGTGVLAEHAVAAGDTVLSVPMELVVYVARAPRRPCTHC